MANTENKFFVGVQGSDRIIFLRQIPQMITRPEALNLAAYLVALADYEGEFSEILEAVKNT